MKHKQLIKIHIATTVIAALTIANFFTFSLIAEIIGDADFIKQVKTVILYCLPVLIIAMPLLALSGKRLAGKSINPLVLQKQKRMKFVAINGLLLISLAIYLYYHANFKTIDTTFFTVQGIELLLGAVNLSLIGLNIRAGLRLSYKKFK
ncbi:MULTISPECIES: hypothetical protein [Aequorivita]|uniref:DUF4293 family protein n=2 Tax=Aequorivita TaxID=153265 RepID=A0AB35YM06_9FLAO|nr:hypothetical protein [Aequorivita sp. Ant34-E75]WGF91575.1 hypothetical protein QCQ61_10180 [Aequorivita sp. Ant34-E75]